LALGAAPPKKMEVTIREFSIFPHFFSYKLGPRCPKALCTFWGYLGEKRSLYFFARGPQTKIMFVNFVFFCPPLAPLAEKSQNIHPRSGDDYLQDAVDRVSISAPVPEIWGFEGAPAPSAISKLRT
jgi:hypothetical protein